MMFYPLFLTGISMIVTSVKGPTGQVHNSGANLAYISDNINGYITE